MAVVDFGIAFWHLLAVLVAIAIKASREYAPKRLTAAELVAQTKLVRDLVAYALRGTEATSADVEDLTQDVIVEAWIASEGDRYRPDPEKPADRSLHAWLWGISKHHAWHHRDRARTRREMLGGYLERTPDSQPSAEELLEAESDLAAIRAVLRALPESHGAVVEAHDVDGEDMKAIAERLGAPVSTVYKWRARGLAALMQAKRPARG